MDSQRGPYGLQAVDSDLLGLGKSRRAKSK